MGKGKNNEKGSLTGFGNFQLENFYYKLADEIKPAA